MASTTASLEYPIHQGHYGGKALTIMPAILIVAAPFFNAGLEPLHAMLMQWLGLVLIGLVLWRPARGPALALTEVLLLGALFLVPLLYLIPWPTSLLALLPGRGVYDQALATAAPALAAVPRALSLHPFATEATWLMTLIPIGVYLASRTLDEQRLIQLTHLLFGVALFQVLIGLFQFATATSGVEYALAEWAPRGGSASGTYRNRNHLAGLLEMVFPLALGLFLYHFGRGPTKLLRTRDWREKTIAVLRAGGRSSLAYGLLGVVFVVGIVITRSRTGIGMAMLGLLLVAVLFSRHIGGGSASVGLMGRILTLTIGIALALGLAPVLDRFAVSDMERDARWPMASATFDGAGALLPLGSGPGTFPDAFPIDQPLSLGEYFINHAHNDYLEAFYEFGVWAPVLCALFIVFFVQHWPRLLAGAEWSRFRCLQLGAGVGIILILGHSLTDYNLHTPANLAYFAFLAGIFFSPPGRLPLIHRKHRHDRRTRRMREEHASAPPTSVPPALDPVTEPTMASAQTAGPDQNPNPERPWGETPSQRQRNPFDD